jgi:hypothetical protein
VLVEKSRSPSRNEFCARNVGGQLKKPKAENLRLEIKLNRRMETELELLIFFGKKDVEKESYGKLKEIVYFFCSRLLLRILSLNLKLKHLKIPYEIKIHLKDLSDYPENEREFYSDKLNRCLKPTNKAELELYRKAFIDR